jgi:transposase
MEEEKAQKLMNDLDDGSDTPKGPGAPQKLSEENAAVIAERLDNDERVEDLAEEFGVCETTIRTRAKPYRRQQ